MISLISYIGKIVSSANTTHYLEIGRDIALHLNGLHNSPDVLGNNDNEKKANSWYELNIFRFAFQPW